MNSISDNGTTVVDVVLFYFAMYVHLKRKRFTLIMDIHVACHIHSSLALLCYSFPMRMLRAYRKVTY